ncbi:glutamate synthase (NADPH/NADH) small chain [Hypnocyclicus thermotrophus]|uniref:Glutamate synthase (NADPH/NADH) small chain n=1 Tax=Hypnocyclicus thermotrophus TaxID=1627895 RepID=A0AA46DXY3_9FUSO|nr:glutamate synthase subunit beta [Hypnocyclicus thermotrophus]TDT69194.1 glutamate synthase (NADPH/NADH) small chain [Hypnocyclicus thermotrophus]
MGKLGGFLEFPREEAQKRPIEERIKDFKELYKPFTDEYLVKQAARCMDCGIPFCHFSCPVGNICPEWNDFAHKGEWEKALTILHSTNNFPEFTGRVCPAPCEGGCVLGINDKPVTIKNIELNIVEKGWENGWIKPMPPKNRTNKKVAVIGSGPAGLAAAQQLNRAGHNVTVYERDSKAGGILTYGIPDYKIEKYVVERRVNQIIEEGVKFIYNTNVGVDISVDELEKEYDAILLAGGSKLARDLPVYGRDLKGIHYAMDYLIQQNRLNAGETIPEKELITAKDKSVIIIGGGDTGADCVGTAIRQGAKTIYQIELLNKPPLDRPQDNPWPNFPQTLKINTAHEEAETCLGGKCELGEIRQWNILTKQFTGDENNNVKEFHAVRVEWITDENGKKVMKEVPNSEFKVEADLVLLAIGFVHPEHDGLINNLKIELDNRGNVKADTKNYQTSKEKIFAAGDMRRGQSLIVWAINEGREAAESINKFLSSK